MYVDMHAHILPCADHGSNSVETSLQQLEMAVAAGVDTVVATTHFYKHSDTVNEFLARRDAAFDVLCNAAPVELRKKLHIVLGAEVTLELGLEELEGLEKLCLGNTKNILIEMPSGLWTPWVFSSLRCIMKDRGLRPIVAHVDRYFNNNLLNDLLDLDLPLQVNASSFEGFRSRRKIMKLVEDGSVHYLGSDIHGVSDEYESFAKAVKRLGDYMESITEDSRIAIGQKEQNSPFRPIRMV